MSLDNDHRWRSPKTLQWLRVHGLYSVLRNIKEEIGGLATVIEANLLMEPPPGL